MQQIISSVIAMALLVACTPLVSAHEVTYRGTVVGLETGRYADEMDSYSGEIQRTRQRRAEA